MVGRVMAVYQNNFASDGPHSPNPLASFVRSTPPPTLLVPGRFAPARRVAGAAVPAGLPGLGADVMDTYEGLTIVTTGTAWKSVGHTGPLREAAATAAHSSDTCVLPVSGGRSMQHAGRSCDVDDPRHVPGTRPQPSGRNLRIMLRRVNGLYGFAR